MEKGRKFKLYEAAGVVLVIALALVAMAYGGDFPALNALATIAAAVCGKLLGIPLDTVVAELLRARPEAAQRIVADAAQGMSAERVHELTRAIVQSMPPTAQQQVVQQLQIIASSPPPANDAHHEPEPDTQPGHKRSTNMPPSSGGAQL